LLEPGQVILAEEHIGETVFVDVGQSDGMAAYSPEHEHNISPYSLKRPFAELDQQAPDPVSSTPPQADVETANINAQHQVQADDEDAPRRQRKAKRIRLLLDVRIELTDDELKIARSQYIDNQERIRREAEAKKDQRESGKIIEGMIWGVPRESEPYNASHSHAMMLIPTSVRAPELADFWLQNLKVHLEAHSERPYGVGVTSEHPKDGQDAFSIQQEGLFEDRAFDWDAPSDSGLGFEAPAVYSEYGGDHVLPAHESVHRPSSEEPGQARRDSLPPSPLGGQFNFNLGRAGLQADLSASSQRSAVFPWDHAGPSSTSAAGQFNFAQDRVSVGHSEVRIRASPMTGHSRRASSIHSSQPGGSGFSPGAFGKPSSQFGEDFAFDVPVREGDLQGELLEEDAKSIILERNSFNFLEYARMQAQTVSNPEQVLLFDAIVPGMTSTTHVAAAAFYHCLVLATKSFIRVDQSEPYGTLAISIR